MQSRVLADCRLFSPRRLLPFHSFIDFLSIPLFVLCLTTPASCSFSLLISTIPTSFLPFPFCLPVVLLSVLAALESWQSLLVMTLSRRLLSGTITSLETFALSPLPSLWAQTRDDCPKTTINRSLPWSLSSPLDACSVVRHWVQTCFRVLTGPWPTPERFSWAGTLCVSLWACACVSVGLSLVGGCFSSD